MSRSKNEYGSDRKILEKEVLDNGSSKTSKIYIKSEDFSR